MDPTYWLDLFTHQTWREFLAAGANVSGFRENRWKTVQNMKPGDVLLLSFAPLDSREDAETGRTEISDVLLG